MSPGNDNLNAALRALAEETAGAAAPDRVRRALAAELRSRARRRAVGRWWPAAAAAALAIGVWLGRPAPTEPAPPGPVVASVEPAPAPMPEPAPAPAPVAEPPRARLASTSAPAPSSAVTPWFFYAGLPPAQRGQVVRIRVNAATAAHFGVYRGDDDVPAQVFIGDDGVARAIRFVR